MLTFVVEPHSHPTGGSLALAQTKYNPAPGPRPGLGCPRCATRLLANPQFRLSTNRILERVDDSSRIRDFSGLFYLATPPEHFAMAFLAVYDTALYCDGITEAGIQAGLNLATCGWRISVS